MTGLFLALLRAAGARVFHPKTRFIGDQRGLDDPEFDTLNDMSEPKSPLPAEWRDGKPLDVIVLTGKGPVNRRGGDRKKEFKI